MQHNLSTIFPAPRYISLGVEVVVLKSKDTGERLVSRHRYPRKLDFFVVVFSLDLHILDKPKKLIPFFGTGACSLSPIHQRIRTALNVCSTRTRLDFFEQVNID